MVVVVATGLFFIRVGTNNVESLMVYLASVASILAVVELTNSGLYLNPACDATVAAGWEPCQLRGTFWLVLFDPHLDMNWAFFKCF